MSIYILAVSVSDVLARFEFPKNELGIRSYLIDKKNQKQMAVLI